MAPVAPPVLTPICFIKHQTDRKFEISTPDLFRTINSFCMTLLETDRIHADTKKSCNGAKRNNHFSIKNLHFVHVNWLEFDRQCKIQHNDMSLQTLCDFCSYPMYKTNDFLRL